MLKTVMLIELRLDQIPEEKIIEFEKRDGTKGASVKLVVTTFSKPTPFKRNCGAMIAMTQQDQEEGLSPTFVGFGTVISQEGQDIKKELYLRKYDKNDEYE